MTVEIQVQGGKVTITVGGQPAPADNPVNVTRQNIVGGDAATEPTSSGGRASGPGYGYGYGALVIGPIVVECCGPEAANNQPNSSRCNAARASGGDAATEGTSSGGDAATEGTSSGGARLMVIGPIVVGGQGGGGPVKSAVNRPAQATSVDPHVKK